MDLDHVLQYISLADKDQITEIVDAAMDRYRAMYPEWDIHYFASEKANPTDPEAVAAFLRHLQKDREKTNNGTLSTSRA